MLLLIHRQSFELELNFWRQAKTKLPQYCIEMLNKLGLFDMSVAVVVPKPPSR